MSQLFVYGAGGFAREVAWLGETCGHDVLGFIDDDEANVGVQLNGLPVMTLKGAVALNPAAVVVAGIGNPSAREAVMTRANEAGLAPAVLIHPRVERSRWLEIGPGSVICAGNLLTANIRLGAHVQINLSCTVGHDVTMDDYVTLAPGVHVSGWVHLQRGCYVGTGANIVNGTATAPVVIGAGAVVGAGACVTKSVAPGMTVVGVPAKPLSKA
jgi:sugar O-acyltransferase (sialic acid O-acetyltransferase NeuD family)